MVISKKGGLRLLLFASIVVLLGGIFYASAAFDSAKSWHPLQQISTSATSGTSVDANENGVVDNADRVGGYDAAALMAAGDGSISAAGGGEGMTYTVVIFDDKGTTSDCPAGYNKYDLAQLAGSNGYAYMHMSPEGLYLGGLADWAWAGSLGTALRARLYSSTTSQGYVCWKTYDASTAKPPRSVIFSVDEEVTCPAGYNTFDLTASTALNGWTYMMQTSYGMFIGQLDHQNYYSYGDDTVILQHTHNTHTGKTCWKVENVIAP